MHPVDRILSETIIDFYVRENITHCKHEVLRAVATLGGHYILVIYLEGIRLDNLLTPEWEQFKMLCAEQSVEVTDYDTVLFFDGSIFELHPYAFREIRQADTEEIIYMAGQHMPVLFVVLVFSLLPSEC